MRLRSKNSEIITKHLTNIKKRLFKKTEKPPQACVELAKCYEQGAGCVRDLTDAFKWRLEAANQGLRSQFIPVAESYRDGIGVPKNPEQEFYWYSRAADYGDEDSQLKIALCL